MASFFQIEIPQIGQTFSRDLMPQIGKDSINSFLKYVDDLGIERTLLTDYPTEKLKSTQAVDFDSSKIRSLMLSKSDCPIIISNDDHVADGHHRWLANHNSPDNQKIDCHRIDLPILELIKVCKDWNNQVKEELTRKDFQPMVDSFVSFASDKLGIKSLPTISYKDDTDGDQPSFGGYSPHNKSIVISTKNRHPMDIFRTLAHELVHSKQDEDGRIGDVKKEGSTGSDIENEANAWAGKIMRWYGKNNPQAFNMKSLIEMKLKPSDREEGTDSVVQCYIDDTPGQKKWKFVRRINESYTRPKYLYHGTHTLNLDSIKKNGIKPGEMWKNSFLTHSATHAWKEAKRASNISDWDRKTGERLGKPVVIVIHRDHPSVKSVRWTKDDSHGKHTLRWLVKTPDVIPPNAISHVLHDENTEDSGKHK